jgi:DNA replication protein DnaC
LNVTDMTDMKVENGLIDTWNFDDKGQVHDSGPEALPELPPDYELVRQYIRCCPDCGREIRERTSISPERILIMERSRCRCAPEPVEDELERVARKQKELDRFFGDLNLAKSPGPDLAELAPRHGQEEAQKMAQVFLESSVTGKSLLLNGPPGRGKTEVALAMARSASADRTVVCIKSIDLLDRIRRSLWQEDKKIELLGILRTVNLLIIDDIGVEKATEWVLATLYAIIDHRYGHRDTVFTTNLTGKEMSSRLGPALTSRIYGSRVVTLAGPDWRIRSRQRISAEWTRDEDKW